jgi:hypothetical protein
VGELGAAGAGDAAEDDERVELEGVRDAGGATDDPRYRAVFWAG